MSTMPLNKAAVGPSQQRNAETSLDLPATPASPGPVKRHRWDQTGKYNKHCRNCDLHALRRPHPYARSWWTEWNRGEQYWNTLQGDKTPPCTPTA
ncbi:hypothetical protein [Streptomyces goshikiensis]|uniref:hypothetical protein n=1 Tax=Streptomyces goshikiensis TaxID=1942 RepID=UPI003668FBC9